MALFDGSFPLKDLPIGLVLYRFGDLFQGMVVERKNRFLVIASHDGRDFECHLHDPGRLKELIFPGNFVLIRRAHAARTEYRISAARRGSFWILVDSGIHSDIASHLLCDGFRQEVPLSGKRIDFAWESGAGIVYLEVKGCSLALDSVALFPDAPTKRGTEQVRALTDYVREGGRAYVLFLVFSEDATSFQANSKTDPDFADQLEAFLAAGGEVLTAKAGFRGNTLVYLGSVPLGG
ncbi:MAG: DNA/RNA nuclease SfsA [Candidatus Thermoplasmatota archaeon]|nr:DNA/RNA nuclease SfsA [Candidatus Thermoplasmatota archaeon]